MQPSLKPSISAFQPGFQPKTALHLLQHTPHINPIPLCCKRSSSPIYLTMCRINTEPFETIGELSTARSFQGFGFIFSNKYEAKWQACRVLLYKMAVKSVWFLIKPFDVKAMATERAARKRCIIKLSETFKTRVGV